MCIDLPKRLRKDEQPRTSASMSVEVPTVVDQS